MHGWNKNLDQNRIYHYHTTCTSTLVKVEWNSADLVKVAVLFELDQFMTGVCTQDIPLMSGSVPWRHGCSRPRKRNTVPLCWATST